MKKFLIFFLTLAMVLTMAITVNADKVASDSDTLSYWRDTDQTCINVSYRLQYYRYQNCVKARTGVYYEHNRSEHYDLPSYILLTVVHATGSNVCEEGVYMESKNSIHELQYDILPSDSLLTTATALFKVNYDVTYEHDEDRYVDGNPNYTDSTRTLTVVYP